MAGRPFQEVPLRMAGAGTSESDVELQGQALPDAPTNGRMFRFAAGLALASGCLVAAATLMRKPVRDLSNISSLITKDADDGICFMTILHGCGCANCDATITEDGEEKCFSTVAVKDTDDDNGECHQYSTKCSLEVGKTYTAKCTGDWDSGAKLQIGGLEFCDGEEETKEFVAKAAVTVPAQETYEKIMGGADEQHVMDVYGWSGSLLSCLQTGVSSMETEFDKDTTHTVEWDDLDSGLKSLLETGPTCGSPGQANGVEALRACMDKQITDHKAAHEGDDDDDDW